MSSAFLFERLGQGEEVEVYAAYLGDRLEMGRVRATLVQTPGVRVHGDGMAILFRYGVVVTFGLSQKERKELFDELAEQIENPFDRPRTDRIYLRLDESQPTQVLDTVIRLEKVTPEVLQTIAHVIARNVLLRHYESEVAKAFEVLEPLATEIASGKQRRMWKDADLERQIGVTFLTETKIVARAEVSDKPYVIWDRPELERIYERLELEYEISDRQTALDRKLDLIRRTAQTALDLEQNEHALRLERAILFLILFEVVFNIIDTLILRRM